MLNRVRLRTDSWDTLLATGVQVDFMPLTATLWAQTLTWLSICFTVCTSSPAFQWRQCQKPYWSLGTQYLLLSIQLPSQSFHHLSRWWIHANDSKLFSGPTCTWKWLPGSFHYLHRHQGEADKLIVSWALLLVLLEDRGDICFPPVLRHLSQSPLSFKDNRQWSLNDISSFPSTHGCILSGPMDLCRFGLLKYSLTWFFSTKGKSFLLQTFPVFSGSPDV